MDIMETCYATHKSRLDKCMDIDILKFINDATSRINSFMKKLRNEFEENIKNEYRFNIKFRRYVDRYCERRNVTVEEALGNESVRKACMRYTEV